MSCEVTEYELITGLFGWTEEKWVDPKFKFENNTERIKVTTPFFRNSRKIIDLLYDALVSGKRNEVKNSFLHFPTTLKPVINAFDARNGEATVDLFEKKKEVGWGQIKLFDVQPNYTYTIERKISSSLPFDYITEKVKDRLWCAWLGKDKNIKVVGAPELEGNRFDLVFSFSNKPTNPRDNTEKSRVYAYYRGFSIEDIDKDIDSCVRTGMLLFEFGSEKSGFYKMKKFPHLNQKFIYFQGLKLPLYTSRERSQPFIAG